MVTVVVILNLLISLACFFAAWRIWKLRRTLGNVADTLTAAEKSTYSVLNPSPRSIYKGQKGIRGLTERYQSLEVKVQQLEKILGILNLIPRFWRQQSTWRRSQPRAKRVRQEMRRNKASNSKSFKR